MARETDIDLRHGRRLKYGAIAAPILMPVLPVVVTFVLLLLAAGGPPAAVVILFIGVVASILAFIAGLTVSFVLGRRYSRWTRQTRELIAANGIRPEELHWFRNELKPAEKRALKAVEACDLLLADAYRETLASRLTATRIQKSSKRELQLAKSRQSSLKQLKSARKDDFGAQIEQDIEKISGINEEAKLMLIEAESRLHMIEAAASRGGSLADNELALKKLSARSKELPLALEAAKIADEIRREFEAEDDEIQ